MLIAHSHKPLSEQHYSELNYYKDLLPEKYFKPDYGFILVVPDEVRLKRQSGRGKNTETFEAKPDAFQQKVNAAYPRIAKDFGLTVIDASGTIEEIFAEIKQHLV